MRISLDDPLRGDVVDLLAGHLADMRATSPPDSVHALEPAGLARPGTRFWTLRDDDGRLLGCAALQRLEPGHAEIKSMRTAPDARRRGVAARLLDHLLAQARGDGVARVSLETGSQPFFEPARALYRSRGFAECGPFGAYRLDPSSVFMTRELDRSAAGPT